MRPVVLVDHPNVVSAKADVDDCSAGLTRLSVIALALSLSLVVRAHRGEGDTEKQRENSSHAESVLPTDVAAYAYSVGRPDPPQARVESPQELAHPGLVARENNLRNQGT
jgi:hypothetical protein